MHPQMVAHRSTNPAAHVWQSTSQCVGLKSDAITITLQSHVQNLSETVQQ